MMLPSELNIQKQRLVYSECNAYQKVIYRQIAQALENVKRWERLPKGKEAGMAKREDIGVLKFLISRYKEYKDINAISIGSSVYEKVIEG